MKKLIMLVLSLVLMSSAAYAMDKNDARYKEMIKIKQEQREAREAKRKAAPVEKKPGFWSREKDRSGLGETGSRFGGVFQHLNPAPFFKSKGEQYEARKSGSIK
jgi:hypothetical protein